MISAPPKPVYLSEDPCSTNKKAFLEEVLEACKGYRYLNAIQSGSIGVSLGVPTNTCDKIGHFLPGGIIIRARYDVETIRRRYHSLR